MNRMKAVLLAICLFVATVFIRGYYFSRFYDVPNNSVRKILDQQKFKDRDILLKNIGNETLILMGSSELGSLTSAPFHPNAVFDCDDKNILLIGSGGCQSIIHAAILGSIGQDLPKDSLKKVAFIISPQWFAPGGIQEEAFLDKISLQHVLYTLKNTKISKDLKMRFMDRILEKSKNNDEYQKIFKAYRQAYLEEDRSLVLHADIELRNHKYQYLNKRIFAESNPRKSTDANKRILEPLESLELLTLANEEGEKSCTNNSLFIMDEYYTKYIEPRLAELKDRELDASYNNSEEYEDLKLLIEIAKSNGIVIELYHIPLNGFWSDYSGLSRDARDQYYDRIRKIAEISAVRLVDLTDKEYEPYFFKDIMHIGWKGWVYIDENLYRFFFEK